MRRPLIGLTLLTALTAGSFASSADKTGGITAPARGSATCSMRSSNASDGRSGPQRSPTKKRRRTRPALAADGTPAR